MSYHDLSSCSLTEDERREEADRLSVIIGEFQDKLTETELSFIKKQRDGFPVSVKQLFWMRDIRDRYL
jgi:hypothetical protein